jgi:hypothetical protein
MIDAPTAVALAITTVPIVAALDKINRIPVCFASSQMRSWTEDRQFKAPT